MLGSQPPPLHRQTPVKTLPCPKPGLCVVITDRLKHVTRKQTVKVYKCQIYGKGPNVVLFFNDLNDLLNRISEKGNLLHHIDVFYSPCRFEASLGVQSVARVTVVHHVYVYTSHGLPQRRRESAFPPYQHHQLHQESCQGKAFLLINFFFKNFRGT